MKLLAALLLTTALFAQSLSLDPSLWEITDVYQGFYAVPLTGSTPLALIGGGLALDLPDRSTAYYLARVQTAFKGKTRISGTLSATFRVITTGAPVFLYDSEAYNTCIYPANIRPHFYTQRQIKTRDGRAIYGWWANPQLTPSGFDIATNANSTVTVNIPLAPDQWSNNIGQIGTQDAATQKAFLDGLDMIDTIGLSIGGGCFFGHGVNVSGGTARLEILNINTL